MAKSKIKKVGLDREDLWKFVPKKTKTSLIAITASVLFESLTARATNLKTTMQIPSDTKVNFPIAVSVAVLAPLVKSKDWPRSIRAYVELIEGKKKLKAEIITEKGHVFWVKDYELFDAQDFPQSEEISFLPKGEITEYDAMTIRDCLAFAELAQAQTVNEAVWDIDIQDHQMRGFDVNMGVVYPTALEECRISTDVAKYCHEGGALYYGADRAGGPCVQIAYGNGSWIAGRVGNRTYPQVENLFENDLKVWFSVKAKVFEWKRSLALMMNYWQKGRSVRVSTKGDDEAVMMGLYEFAPNQKHECIDVDACPLVELSCEAFSEGPNSMAFNPKLLKTLLDQFEDHTTFTLQFYGVRGKFDAIGNINHVHKPLRIFNDQKDGRRLLMPVVDWAQRIHSGDGAY